MRTPPVVRALVIVAFLPALAADLAAADSVDEPETVTVRSEPVTARFQAYARIEPISLLPVRAGMAGVVVSVQVTPGTAVEAGQKLAELGGPEIRALLTARQGAVRSARDRLAAAKRALAAERQQLSAQLSTQQAVAEAQSAVTTAAAGLDDAQAQLRAAERMRTLSAPSAGSVVGVSTAAGARVMAGERLLTLQADDGLWLKAGYYGADAAAIQVGMTGQFEPASGGASVPVKVITVFASVAADGARAVGLMPTGTATSSSSGHSATPARWVNGEFGRVTLNGSTRSMVAVPTRALILDRAEWWVMVRMPQGDHRQAVVPGPTRGWQTFIESGLQPGEQVVVEDAYLEFHEAISQRYQPPD